MAIFQTTSIQPVIHSTQLWGQILHAGKFLPRGVKSILAKIVLSCGNISSWRRHFFLANCFLLGEMVSFSRKRFLPRGNDFFLWKWTLSGGSDSYLVEIISSSPKWYLPRGNNMFLVEITCSLRKWFPRVNAFWHRHVRLGLPYNHGLTCTYATKLRIMNNN